MKKLVSILSATLLATSLAACGAYEEKVVEVEVPASTSTSTKSEARTKITIEQFLWDREIVCRPQSRWIIFGILGRRVTSGILSGRSLG